MVLAGAGIETARIESWSDTGFCANAASKAPNGELSSNAMAMDLIVWQGIAAHTLGFYQSAN
ncbi:MAG TPA: hypothetical protein VHX44_16855 [Planctomycetota bacterium]|nr:hypothetical protein [Planctomycetota bacterium]